MPPRSKPATPAAAWDCTRTWSFQARRLYETELRELPAPDDIVTRLESVRRIQLQVTKKMGTAYEPDTELLGTAQSAGFWADNAMDKVNKVKNLVSALTQEAKIKVTTNTLTAASPTLEGAITQLSQAEAAMRQRIILEQIKPAKQENGRNPGQCRGRARTSRG